LLCQYTLQWQIQGGSLGQLPPPNACGDPLTGAPLPLMHPFLVPVEVETEMENTLKASLFL